MATRPAAKEQTASSDPHEWLPSGAYLLSYA
jgi:hypothetical protein